MLKPSRQNDVIQTANPFKEQVDSLNQFLVNLKRIPIPQNPKQEISLRVPNTSRVNPENVLVT